jgi:hypothetical protein
VEAPSDGEIAVSVLSWECEDCFDDKGTVLDLRAHDRPLYTYVGKAAGTYGNDWLFLVYRQGEGPAVLCEEQD